ncbi:MAG TPA: CPCC family cysteine-rich protein [Polyangiaceae bacterium]|nr:CPCC family cysteine-rich protein [Polyangiaceae bacterium]
MTDSPTPFPCPCCGHLVFAAPPGSEDICLVCFWEDDADQLRWPNLAGGANAVCLREAQRNYQQFGAIEERFRNDVRPATEEEPLDPDFRPIASGDVFEVQSEEAVWPADLTSLYYWRRPAAPPLVVAPDISDLN